jgi:hypothetical protein
MRLPRIAKSEFLFTTSGSSPISGHSQIKARLDEKILEIVAEESGGTVARTTMATARSTQNGCLRDGPLRGPGECDRSGTEPSQRASERRRRGLQSTFISAGKAEGSRGLGTICLEPCRGWGSQQRGAPGSTPVSDEWITPQEVLERVTEIVVLPDKAAADILSKVRSGLIAAMARRFNGNNDVLLPLSFWTGAVSIDFASQSATQSSLSMHGNRRAKGLTLNKRHVDAIWPPSSQQTQQQR